MGSSWRGPGRPGRKLSNRACPREVTGGPGGGGQPRRLPESQPPPKESAAPPLGGQRALGPQRRGWLLGSDSGLTPGLRAPSPRAQRGREAGRSPRAQKRQESGGPGGGTPTPKLPDPERGAGFGDRAGRPLLRGQDLALCALEPQPPPSCGPEPTSPKGMIRGTREATQPDCALPPRVHAPGTQPSGKPLGLGVVRLGAEQYQQQWEVLPGWARVCPGVCERARAHTRTHTHTHTHTHAQRAYLCTVSGVRVLGREPGYFKSSVCIRDVKCVCGRRAWRVCDWHLHGRRTHPAHAVYVQCACEA